MHQSYDYDEQIKKRKREENKRIIKALITKQSRTEETKNRQAKAIQDQEKRAARLEELNNLLSVQSKQLYENLLAEAKSSNAKTAIKKHSKELEKFKSLSDEHYALYTQKHALNPEYNKLFRELSIAYPEFLLYSPTEIFFKPYLPMHKLTEEQLAELRVRLIAEGALSNETFKKKYLKFFPEHINIMNNFDDILYVLRDHPEKFNDINEQMKTLLNNNVEQMVKLVSNAPGVVEYLSYEQIKRVAFEKPGTLGSAICRCPRVLNNIYPGFFNDFNPKIIFTHSSKQEVKAVVKDYLPKFPELEKYLDTSVSYDVRQA